MSLAPHSEITHTVLALSAVTAASFVGSVSFSLGKRLNSALPYLVSAAAGALLATASTHLVLEAVQRLGPGRRLGLLLLAGFLISFLLERLLLVMFQKPDSDIPTPSVQQERGFHHNHEHTRSSGHPLIANILFSGFIHSLIDGLAIAAAFSVGHNVGLATTLAVLLHEVPHHMADIGILVYSGLSRPRAVLFNLLATAGCGIGGAVVLINRSSSTFLTSALLPITAANFFYIALAILIPEMQKERDRRKAALQISCLAVAAAGLSALSFIARD